MACRGHKVDILCMFFLCVLATPTHHHGHSCLRLRVYVCCSTGEIQHLCLTSIGLSNPFYLISSLSVSVHLHFPLSFYLFVSFQHTNTEKQRQRGKEREKLRSDSLVSERGFSASCCLGKVLMMASFPSKQCFEGDGLMLFSVSVLLQ